MRTGFTTGSCATAAAKAAALRLRGAAPSMVEIPLPDGTRATLPVESTQLVGIGACAAVRKEAGDDPDVTDQALIEVKLVPQRVGGIRFSAGAGVGMVTLPGLPIPPGEPAINPAPRRQIAAGLLEVGIDQALITISIVGGAKLAERTFNSRLGIVGGLSILGTSGRVRAFSHPAVAATVRATLDVALAAGVRNLVLVPGHHGRRAAQARFRLSALQLVEVGDAWGDACDHLSARPPDALLAAGHPSKLVKLAIGQWNTHVSAGAAPVDLVRVWASELGLLSPEVPTVDGVFTSQDAEGRARLAALVAVRVHSALVERLAGVPLAVLLTDLQSGCWGHFGNLTPWEVP